MISSASLTGRMKAPCWRHLRAPRHHITFVCTRAACLSLNSNSRAAPHPETSEVIVFTLNYAYRPHFKTTCPHFPCKFKFFFFDPFYLLLLTVWLNPASNTGTRWASSVRQHQTRGKTKSNKNPESNQEMGDVVLNVLNKEHSQTYE